MENLKAKIQEVLDECGATFELAIGQCTDAASGETDLELTEGMDEDRICDDDGDVHTEFLLDRGLYAAANILSLLQKELEME